MHPMATLLHDNWQAFLDVNGMAGHLPFVDALMVFSAQDLIFLLPVLLLGFWLLFASWSPLMHVQGRGPTPYQVDSARLGHEMALVGCGAVVLALGFNLALGQLIYEPRPFVSHPTVVHLLIAHVADASFPSDHEAVASAVAATLVLYVLLAGRSWLRQLLSASQPSSTQGLRLVGMPALVALLAVLVVLAIGVARVYVGVHYPGDIAGGMGCGVLAASLLVWLRPWLTPALAFCVRVAERMRLA